MKEFWGYVGVAIVFVLLVVGITFGIRHFTKSNTTEAKSNIREELIKELDTNKKIVVFGFEKFTHSIEEEQETLELFINDGLDRNYVISTVEIVEGKERRDRTILIFENGY